MPKSPHPTIHQDVYAPLKVPVYRGTLSDPFFPKSGALHVSPQDNWKRSGFGWVSWREPYVWDSLLAFGKVSIGRADSRRDLTCAFYCLLRRITRVIWRETNVQVEGYSESAGTAAKPVFRLIKVRLSFLLTSLSVGGLLFVVPFIVANVATEWRREIFTRKMYSWWLSMWIYWIKTDCIKSKCKMRMWCKRAINNSI